MHLVFQPTHFTRVLLSVFALSIAGCTDGGESKDERAAKANFEEEFGSQLLGQITDVRFSWSFVRDDFEKWFSFSCDEQTLAALVGRGFVAVDIGRDADLARFPYPSDLTIKNANAPTWWPKINASHISKLHYKNRGEKSKVNYIYLWRDAQSNIVYAHSVRID